MDLDLRYPAVSDLRKRAKARMPHFAFEYLDSGTGAELQVTRNRDALDDVWFLPAVLPGEMEHDLSTTFLGQKLSRPFGIAPLGMSGLIWPGAERILATHAAREGIPYGLSTVATRLPEEVGPQAGEMGWFQLYCPASEDIRRDMMKRAWNAGFKTLVLTVDVPDDSRRERQRRANLSLPPKITPGMIWETLTHPAWALGTLKLGRPRLRLPESYIDRSESRSSLDHAGHIIRGAPDWQTLDAIRAEWKGHLIIKGVMDPDAAKRLVKAGVDAIWVSNHGGRQLEGAPAAITQLPVIREAVGSTMPLIYDSGVVSGLDVMRALALGADLVMLGRAWHYAVAALGEAGAAHLHHVLSDDMALNMAQIGAQTLKELRPRLWQKNNSPTSN